MISTPMADHFIGVNKKVEIGSGAFREVDDIMLTCYACYLIAQNSDPRKPLTLTKNKQGICDKIPYKRYIN